MLKKSYIGKPAQITFTSDFHELVTGDLRPGWSVTLRYDPRRIVPASEQYVFGDPNRPISAHFRFRHDSPVLSQTLASTVGLLSLPHYDIAGQGSILTTTVTVPTDAERLVVWFSFQASSGETIYDSDMGANFYFRFPSIDIHILDAIVVSDPAIPTSVFTLRLSTVDTVESISVRFRIVGDAKFGKSEMHLIKTDQKDPDGRSIWSISGVAIPYRSTVQFKIFYWINGVRHKDDNGGHYFFAPEPPVEKMPAVPKELAAAAKKWNL